MRKSAIYFLFILLFSFSQIPAQAAVQNLPQMVSVTLAPTPVEYALPFPGILPDNPLYPIKVLRDRILQLFTKDPVKKSQLKLLLSDKRLVMGEFLWEKGNYNLSIDTITKSEKYLLDSAIIIVNYKKQNNLPPGLSDKVELAIKKHEEVINHISSVTDNVTFKTRLADAIGVNHQAADQIVSIK